MRRLLLLAAFVATPALAQGGVSYPPARIDLTGVPTPAEVKAAKDAADAAAAAASAAVKTVNGLSPNAAGAVTLALPTASTTMPPCISNTGSAGTTTTMVFAPFNHTHCSKARSVIATTAADGSYIFDYSSTPFANPPTCTATARVAANTTDVVNAQIIGDPTTTRATILVNRSVRNTNALLQLTILQVAPTPGVTRVDIICIES